MTDSCVKRVLLIIWAIYIFWTEAETLPSGDSICSAGEISGYVLCLLSSDNPICAGLFNPFSGRNLLLFQGMEKERIRLVSVNLVSGNAVFEYGKQWVRLTLWNGDHEIPSESEFGESLATRRELIQQLVNRPADSDWLRQEIEDYQVEAVRAGQSQLPFTSPEIDQRLHSEGLLPASPVNCRFEVVNVYGKH